MMKKFILFISLLLTSCAHAPATHTNNYNYSFTKQDYTSSDISSLDDFEDLSSSSAQVESKDPYNITTERIMLDVVTAVYNDAIPDNPYSMPDFDGVISSNYPVEWDTPTLIDDNSLLGLSLIEFQRIENFPDYLFIHQPPMKYTIDNKEIMGMFMVTSNCLHMLCVYDYFIGDQIYIEFEAGPYAAFI